jgi:uncharacterized protein
MAASTSARLDSAGIARALVGTWRSTSLLSVERAESGEALEFVTGALNQRLCIVPGVGPWHEAQLRDAGFASLDELQRHPRFGVDATRCFEGLRRRDAIQLNVFKQRGAPIGELLSLFVPHELVFLDIETMGLGFGQEVFLIGMLHWRNAAWYLRQLILLDLNAQKELLAATLDDLAAFRACATYNGASFDIPFLRAAAEFADLPTRPLDELFHADLLYPTRRTDGPFLSDCRLATVAADILGVSREDDISGALVPSEFLRFLRSGEMATLERILEHNRQDLLNLRDLTRHVCA